MSDNRPFSFQNASTRETIQAELAEARKSFLALLASLSDADFRQKSTTSAWTVKELLVHMVFWLNETPRAITMVRRGKVRKISASLFAWLNLWLTRLAAWRQTRQSITTRYERAYQALLLLVAGIQEQEWKQGASFGGPFHGEYRTIEKIIRSHRTHVQEHSAEIWQSLYREEAQGASLAHSQHLE